MAADGKTVAICGNDNVNVGVHAHSSITNQWHLVGDDMLASGGPISMSHDGTTLVTGGNNFDNNGDVRAYRFQNIILAKEHGWCTNQFGVGQESGRIELSKGSFGPLIEDQD